MSALALRVVGDIHIFWWQACGKAFENYRKQLIYIVFFFTPTRQARVAVFGFTTPSGCLCSQEDIHIFCWQACAEPLEKSLKSLIRQHILKTQQEVAAPGAGISTAGLGAAIRKICTYFVCKTVENVLTSHPSP